MIDYVISILTTATIVILLSARVPGQPMPPYITVIYVLVPLLYVVLMESSRLQATLGKLAVGIKVSDLVGDRISLGRALGRFLAHIFDGLTLGVGYGMAAFTERRQALHDKVAGTLVVRRTCDPATIRAAELAPTSGTRSALVVIAMLLFGPFSIGTLAAIAIPAYQNYTIRAQVTEGLNAVDSFKIAVAEAVSQGRNWPEINTETLGLPQPDNLHYVESIRVDTGAVVIDYGRAANKAIWGMRIVLVPGMTPERATLFGFAGAPRFPLG